MPENAPVPAQKNPWLSRVPELEDGRRFPSLAPAQAAKLFAELLAADPQAITSLIAALHEVDDGSDWKARFVLGALASFVGAPDRATERAKLEVILAGALGADRPDGVKTFLVRQLQWFAGAAATAAIAAQLGSASPELVDAAAAALVAIGTPGMGALKEAQHQAEGHARRAIDHALAR